MGGEIVSKQVRKNGQDTQGKNTVRRMRGGEGLGRHSQSLCERAKPQQEEEGGVELPRYRVCVVKPGRIYPKLVEVSLCVIAWRQVAGLLLQFSREDLERETGGMVGNRRRLYFITSAPGITSKAYCAYPGIIYSTLVTGPTAWFRGKLPLHVPCTSCYQWAQWGNPGRYGPCQLEEALT